MNKKLTQKLFDRFSFFHPEKPIMESMMRFGFSCEDGWFDLIWKLSEDLETLSKEEDCILCVVQVKEKFGNLRYYTTNITDKMGDRIEKAEKESMVICEVCGEKAVLCTDNYGWYKTVCVKHREDEFLPIS